MAVDPGDLRDLLDILVDNVFAHTPEGTAFAITLEPVDDAVRLVVEDRGPGIPDRAHRPADREGFTGLGLQIVRRTVDGFGGRTSIRPGTHRGTVVEIRMPLVPSPT